MPKRFLIILLAQWVLSASLNAEKLKVATLHPLMTDLARQVGGADVDVISLLGPNDDPHHFSPSPKTLVKAHGAKIYLASGKNMEPYLGKLRNILGKGIPVIEVGRSVPSLKISGQDAQYVCCPKHVHGAIDPHWWHKVSNMKKAARVVAKEFSKIDSKNASVYKSRALAYGQRLSELDSWIKRETSKIPSQSRILCTAHTAFGYFCKEYQFRSLPLQGLSANNKTTASYQAEAIQAIHDHKVKAIFPEKRANPKALKIITKETQVKLGGTLIADGADHYELMMKSNVTRIVTALSKP